MTDRPREEKRDSNCQESGLTGLTKRWQRLGGRPIWWRLRYSIAGIRIDPWMLYRSSKYSVVSTVYTII